MKFNKLPFDVKRVPAGFFPIECYGDDKGNIVIPIEEPQEGHNCDANGCGTFSHVERFKIGNEEIKEHKQTKGPMNNVYVYG